MNTSIKIIKIIIINILAIIFILFFIDLIFWGIENQEMKKEIEMSQDYREYPQTLKLPVPFFRKVIDFEKYKHTCDRPIRPQGLEYKKSPILIFGCSYAYGIYLKPNQKFSYKLSKLAQRPVYNKALCGMGMNYMLYLTKSEDLYKRIPEPEHVIYVFMGDHFRRILTCACSQYDILKGFHNLRYKQKNGKLTRILIEKDPFYIIKNSHTAMHLQSLFVNKILLTNSNYENYFNFAIQHFTESKKEMQKHWKNTTYSIIIYGCFKNDKIFCKELENKGFKVIYIPNLGIINIKDMTHHFPDFHPKESAWDIITPKIIEILNL